MRQNRRVKEVDALINEAWDSLCSACAFSQQTEELERLLQQTKVEEHRHRKDWRYTYRLSCKQTAKYLIAKRFTHARLTPSFFTEINAMSRARIATYALRENCNDEFVAPDGFHDISYTRDICGCA